MQNFNLASAAIVNGKAWPYFAPRLWHSGHFVSFSGCLQITLEGPATMLEDVEEMRSSKIESGNVQRPLVISGSRGVATHLLGPRRICIYDVEEPG